MIIDTKNLPNDTESLQDLLRKQNSYVSHLEEQIKLLLLKRYGSRAEYIPLGQRSLFDEAELARLDQISAIIPIDNSDAATSTTTVPEHERKKRARKPLPEELERVKLYHVLKSASSSILSLLLSESCNIIVISTHVQNVPAISK